MSIGIACNLDRDEILNNASNRVFTVCYFSICERLGCDWLNQPFRTEDKKYDHALFWGEIRHFVQRLS